MSVESRPNKLTKGLVLDTFHTDVDNTVATYALNAQLEDQEGNHFHYGSEVGTTFIKDIPDKHVVIGHINMERNETVLFTTDGTNSTIGVLSRNDDMSYHYEIKVDDSKQTKKLGFKKEGYVRGVYRLLNGCDKVIYFVDGINKDRRININQLDSYKLPDTQSVASGIIFDDSLRATIFALSSATGNIQLIRLLSASPEATANVLANLTSGESLTKLLTASANGIGTAFANLMRTANMISSTNSTGTSTANVDIIRLLQSNISSIGSVNAILDVKTQGVVEIDVTLTGVASSTAILLRAALLESNITTEASTLTTAILTRIINAQVQASATTTSTAKITVPVNASANATANTAANAILSYAVNATANAIAQTSATAQLSQVINASLNATATSSVEALIGLVLVSTTTANGSVSTADLYINRLLSSSVTATGTTTAEALIAKLLQSSVTASANTTSNAIVSKLASSSVTASANTTANSLVSKLIASTVNAAGNVTADLKIADLLSTSLSGTASAEALLDVASSLFTISRSLRFNSTDLTYLNRTPTVAGNRRTWTWSGWVKKTKNADYQGLFSAGSSSTNYTAFRFENNDKLIFFMSNATVANVETTQLFRDNSSWYHIVLSVDTNQTTSSDRIKIYVNNVQASFSTALYPGQVDGTINSSSIVHVIGTTYTSSPSLYLNGYMSEVNFIDGQALTPDSFGIRNTSTGVWSPKEYTGTYGTNGFHLNFSDITQLGKDFSGNNNNWTPSGFSVTPGVGYDSLTDVPTPNGTDNGFGGEVRGNYATLNPLENQSLTITNGNLDASYTTTVWKNIKSTFSMPSGKWYFEFVHTTGTQYTQIGVIKTSIQLPTTYFSQSPFGWSYSAAFGELRNNNNATNSGIFTSAIGDIINVAVDIDAGKIWFGKNGTWFNNGMPSSGINAAYTNLSGEMSVAVGVYNTNNPLVSFNSGQQPFTYQAPTGFKALNTANLPTPAIGGGGESNLANKYMDITTYTGTGAAQSIFNSGFKPDFVWIKSRSAPTSHILYDINRGVQKRLSTDSTAAEVTDTTGLSSFDNTGFSIGALSQINASGATYVAWQWRAGGTPVTNNSETITSQVSVSQISGFSVVRYTVGASGGGKIGHGLGVTPKFIINKVYSRTENWRCYFESLGATKSIYLNATAASTTDAVWGNTAPTSNAFTIGNAYLSNGDNVIAYCFAEIEGYSKFGSYLGNNSTDGTFVYTGFKPKYILIKCSTAAANWVLYNSIVNTGNPVINELFINTTNAENGTPSDEIDFLSNGFKLRSTNAAINAAQTYIYAAFAETPFKYATAGLTPEVKETISVDYLVIAGGGGGGGSSLATSSGGSGGGAGGYRTSFGTSGGGALAESKLILTKGNVYTIIVGGPGSGGTGLTAGGQGTASSISGTGIITKSTVGGGGGSSGNGDVQQATTGGSAGGGGTTAKLGTTNEGFNGGTGGVGGDTPGGGGGGAAGNGGNGISSTEFTGAGGLSLQSSITGTSIYRAGGGGGGDSNSTTSGGLGGTNSGGNGGTNTTAATQGQQNTGGGGGGGSKTFSDRNGRAGGSGVVIIRSPIDITNPSDYFPAIRSTDGTDFIFTFNGDGSIKFS